LKIASVRVGAEDLLAFESSNGHIYSPPAALQIATGPAPDWSRDRLAVIEVGIAALDGLAQAGDLLARRPDAIEPLPLESIVWHPPVRTPSKICCLALNNSANADRVMSGPAHPAAFFKAADAPVGHGQPICVKEHYGRVHPEPKLAVIIVKTPRNVDLRMLGEPVSVSIETIGTLLNPVETSP
jgi:2-keto-4-pentenoate hydratase/2-oxohepta-3-ene-1,7-dioic acid hydratase in catechol pathway